MRTVARFAATAAGRLVEAAGRAERAGGLVILGYHRIDDGGGLGIHPDEFERHLEWIEEAGLEVVDVEAEPAPAGRRPRIAITFDDGYASVAEVAWPALRARRWPATLYVVAGCLERGASLPWDGDADERHRRLLDAPDVAALAADGMRIGAHSWSHRYLPHVPPGEWPRELADARARLEEVVGHQVTTFAYPAGGWHRRLREAVAVAGYATAVTCDRGRNTAGSDRLALRRHIVEAAPVALGDQVRGHYDFLRLADDARRHVRNFRGRP